MLTARDCLRIAAGNKFKRWIPATDSEVGDRRTAMARLSNHSYFVPGITPKFTLSPTDKVFTIGSCFARSIENALVERHIDVITAKLDIDPRLIVTSGGPFAVPTSVRTILNKYNASAIRSELERVLEPRPIPDDGFVEVKPGLYIDPQLSMLKPAPMEAAKRTRATVETLLSSVRNADAVFITLGLTETWQDRKTGLYLNAGPPPQIMARESGRFLFVNSTVEHSFAEMERTITLIEKHSSKSPRFIVTVSPVPLNTTWTTMDVVVANTYSKSALRVVCQMLSERPNVDYFPSYEMVMLSPRELAWGQDQMHVRTTMVAEVVSHFTKNYVISEKHVNASRSEEHIKHSLTPSERSLLIGSASCASVTMSEKSSDQWR